jgi:hypothetical protein
MTRGFSLSQEACLGDAEAKLLVGSLAKKPSTGLENFEQATDPYN